MGALAGLVAQVAVGVEIAGPLERQTGLRFGLWRVRRLRAS